MQHALSSFQLHVKELIWVKIRYVKLRTASCIHPVRASIKIYVWSETIVMQAEHKMMKILMGSQKKKWNTLATKSIYTATKD